MHQVNRLASELSPYLLQHAHNPVNWFPWGNEAFESARLRNVPVIVSIGYSACHWCHVMERECFENEDIARIMNENFVCIKVDREEYPDVDHVYMDAVQAISGSGGWPLNVFVTPEGVPFYGGTYFPPKPAYNRPSWPALLERVADLWNNKRDDLDGQAAQLQSFLEKSLNARVHNANGHFGAAELRKIADSLVALSDKEYGGFGNAPKFPGTMAINYLMAHARYQDNKQALEVGLNSLDAMMHGGIYDQLGGGFARYATDRKWLIPHFEKMLYDNALLIVNYVNAFKISNNERYLTIIKDTIDFLDRELRGESGLYYCALDADSEGEEGKFYTWHWQEWEAILGKNAALAAHFFGVDEEGNWEGNNILSVPGNLEHTASCFGVAKLEAEAIINEAKALLFAARCHRIRPGTDDKALLSWNALMCIALCEAATLPGFGHYITKAEEQMRQIMQCFVVDGVYHRVWKAGTTKITAKLDDLAFLANALLHLGAVTGNNNWFQTAAEITEQIVAHFSRDDDFFYFTPEGQNDMPMRKVDLYDGALPSANAIMAHNLLVLGVCMEQTEWLERAHNMIKNMASQAVANSYSYSYWGRLMQIVHQGIRLVICTGSGAAEAASRIRSHFLPHTLIIAHTTHSHEIPVLKNKLSGNILSIFVCTEQECLQPLTNVEEAIIALQPIK